MEAIIGQELIDITFCIFVVNHIIISCTVGLNNKIKEIEEKRIRNILRIVLITFAISLVIFFTAKPIRLCIAYIEFRSDNVKVIEGRVDEMKVDNHRRFVTIEDKKYIIFRAMNSEADKIDKGDVIHIKAGKYSNYVFELE